MITLIIIITFYIMCLTCRNRFQKGNTCRQFVSIQHESWCDQMLRGYVPLFSAQRRSIRQHSDWHCAWLFTAGKK